MRGGLAALLANKEPQTPTVVEETALNFLRRLPPFQYLDQAALHYVVTQAELQYFPQDTQIFRQGIIRLQDLRPIGQVL